MKNKIGFFIGISVVVFLLLMALRTTSVLNLDINDDEVESIALNLGLVNAEEENYPSLREMEERVQQYRAGEVFTDMGVGVSVVLCIGILLLSVGLSFYKMMQDKQKMIRFAIPSGSLVLILFFSWVSADTSSSFLADNQVVPVGDLITVSTLVSSTVVLLVISIVALIALNVYKLLSK